MIVQCRVVTDKNTGQCQGFGFILYTKREEALAAIKVILFHMHGNRMQPLQCFYHRICLHLDF